MIHKRLVNYENEHKSAVYPECDTLPASVEILALFVAFSESSAAIALLPLDIPEITLINMQEILINSALLKIVVIVQQKYADLHTRH